MNCNSQRENEQSLGKNKVDLSVEMVEKNLLDRAEGRIAELSRQLFEANENINLKADVIDRQLDQLQNRDQEIEELKNAFPRIIKDPLGDDHHTEKPLSDQDIRWGQHLANIMGSKYSDIDPSDYHNFFFTKSTSTDEWARVARALRYHGLIIINTDELSKLRSQITEERSGIIAFCRSENAPFNSKKIASMGMNLLMLLKNVKIRK